MNRGDMDFGGLARDLDRKRELSAKVKPAADVAALLTERKTTHGEYRDDARAAMRLKDNLADEINRRVARGQTPLVDIQRHALDMILHKIARIVTGDAWFKDHWDDIAGYATLVAARIEPPEDHQNERPLNGADVLAEKGKVPCPCKANDCLVRDGVEMKYAYCVRGRDGRPGRRDDG